MTYGFGTSKYIRDVPPVVSMKLFAGAGGVSVFAACTSTRDAQTDRSHFTGYEVTSHF